MLDGCFLICYNDRVKRNGLTEVGMFATVKGAAAPSVQGTRLRYLGLWDAYGPLLTDLQREICGMYYSLDLSLSEIAEEKGVSKQAVSDTLKKCRELLDSYEEKLHFKRDNDEYSRAVSFMMTEVVRALEAFGARHPEFAEEIGKITDMVCVGEAIDLDLED